MLCIDHALQWTNAEHGFYSHKLKENKYENLIISCVWFYFQMYVYLFVKTDGIYITVLHTLNQVGISALSVYNSSNVDLIPTILKPSI